jgi:hypothetical protein
MGIVRIKTARMVRIAGFSRCLPPTRPPAGRCADHLQPHGESQAEAGRGAVGGSEAAVPIIELVNAAPPEGGRRRQLLGAAARARFRPAHNLPPFRYQ